MNSLLNKFIKATRIQKALLVCIALLLSLFFAELILRYSGMIPGYVGTFAGEYLELKHVDSLIVDDYFYTDSLGIYKARPGGFPYDRNIQINADGFRSPDFNDKDSLRKKVMLIGDSFTWGAQAEPITQSFADIVRATGIEIFNLGIPGAEPNQYKHIAEIYIPYLKPDAVVVQFYMGNDILYNRWDIKPNCNRYHITNAGWLNAYLDGDYIGNPTETLEYYLIKYSIPNPGKNWINGLCSKTVLTTKLWMIFHKLGWIKPETDDRISQRIEKYNHSLQKEPVSYEYMKAIKDLCDSLKIKFILIAIKTHTDLDIDIEKKMPMLFRELPFCTCTTLLREDYREWPDGHFTNQGHRKFADCILTELRKN